MSLCVAAVVPLLSLRSSYRSRLQRGTEFRFVGHGRSLLQSTEDGLGCTMASLDYCRSSMSKHAVQHIAIESIGFGTCLVDTVCREQQELFNTDRAHIYRYNIHIYTYNCIHIYDYFELGRNVQVYILIQ